MSDLFIHAFNSIALFLSTGSTNAPLWELICFTLVATHITIASVTIYLHRHQAHRSLDLHPAAAHFFRFWLWLTTAIVTREWVCIHRKHHAKCDTAEDPHSPHAHGIKTVLLRGAELYRTESKNEVTITRYKHGTPDDWLERNLYSRFSLVGVALLLLIEIALFGASGLVIWAVQMLWIPVNAAGIINGLGHWTGYRNFETQDVSMNLLPWGIFIGGEELHNNHHTYPTSAKLSVKPYEFDIGWLYIRCLSAVGLAKVKKIHPKIKSLNIREISLSKTPAIQDDTLQSVIHNRYELMARYSKVIRRVCSQELRELETKGLRASAQWQNLAQARRWIGRHDTVVPQRTKAQVVLACEQNTALIQLLQMRQDLQSIWTRANVGTETLLGDLRDWHARAMLSSLRPLQEFAHSITGLQLKTDL